MLVRVLAARVQTGPRVAEDAVEVTGRLVEHVFHAGERERLHETGVVFEHLLEMGHAPVLRRRVAEEAALDVVVGPAACHLLERVHRHPSQLFVAAQRGLLEEEKDGVCLRELRGAAEAAVLRVVSVLHRAQDFVDQGGVQGAGAASHPRGRSLPRLQDAAGDLRLVVAVVARDRHQRAGHLVRRQVGGAGEDVARRCEKRGRRPAAHVVALVDVGANVVVDAHRHVVTIDDVDHARVGVGGLVHDVAPVTPHRGDGEQDRTPNRPGFVERLLRPRAPVDLGRAVGPRREVKFGRGLTHRGKVTMRS